MTQKLSITRGLSFTDVGSTPSLDILKVDLDPQSATGFFSEFWTISNSGSPAMVSAL